MLKASSNMTILTRGLMGCKVNSILLCIKRGLSCRGRGVFMGPTDRLARCGKSPLSIVYTMGRGTKAHLRARKVESRRFVENGTPVAGRRIHAMSLSGLQLATSSIYCSINTKANSLSVRVTLHTRRKRM